MELPEVERQEPDARIVRAESHVRRYEDVKVLDAEGQIFIDDLLQAAVCPLARSYGMRALLMTAMKFGFGKGAQDAKRSSTELATSRERELAAVLEDLVKASTELLCGEGHSGACRPPHSLTEGIDGNGFCSVCVDALRRRRATVRHVLKRVREVLG